MTEERLNKMDVARHLLPPPGDEVAGELIQALRAERERVKELEGGLQNKIASATAHRACCGTEHDPQNGKLHGYCVVCGVPWPCETALTFLSRKDSDGTG